MSSSLVRMSWQYTDRSHLQLGTIPGSGGSANDRAATVGALSHGRSSVVYRATRCSQTSEWLSFSCFRTRVGLLPNPLSRRSRITRTSHANLGEKQNKVRDRIPVASNLGPNHISAIIPLNALPLMHYCLINLKAVLAQIPILYSYSYHPL